MAEAGHFLIHRILGKSCTLGASLYILLQLGISALQLIVLLQKAGIRQFVLIHELCHACNGTGDGEIVMDSKGGDVIRVVSNDV